MRLRFFRPVDEAETAQHLELQRRIDAFWGSLRRTDVPGLLRSESPSAAQGGRAAARITELLRSVDPGLVAEAGTPARHLQLAISPREATALDPLAQAVLARTPATERRYFVRHRAPCEPARALSRVRDELGLDLTTATVRAGFARGHLLEVVLFSHEFTSAADENALDAANLAVALMLGDEVFDDWIGAVDVSPAPRPSSLRVLTAQATSGGGKEERFSLRELPAAVDRAIEGLRLNLARAPFHTFCEHADWTMLEAEPDGRPDRSGADDLALCTTMLPEMTKCHLEGARFSSTRFSNHGERFVYLKLDVRDGAFEGRHALRTELEEALNYALVPGRLGCVVAGGMGLSHVYVYLALAELDLGLEVARKVARGLEVPERAWLLFCDSVWQDEWLGVWDTTRPPDG